VSRAAIKAGLITVVKTVLPRTYGYEPQTIEAPMAYVLAAGGEVADKGQMLLDRHNFTVRAVVRWTENEQAELQLDTLIDSLPAALRSHLTGGSTLARQTLTSLGAMNAAYTGYTPSFWNVSGVTFRICDFAVTLLDKRGG